MFDISDTMNSCRCWRCTTFPGSTFPSRVLFPRSADSSLSGISLWFCHRQVSLTVWKRHKFEKSIVWVIWKSLNIETQDHHKQISVEKGRAIYCFHRHASIFQGAQVAYLFWSMPCFRQKCQFYFFLLILKSRRNSEWVAREEHHGETRLSHQEEPIRRGYRVRFPSILF